jgi:hypothetical protein
MAILRMNPTTAAYGEEAARLITDEGWDVGFSHVQDRPKLIIECPDADLQRARAIVQGVDSKAKQID